MVGVTNIAAHRHAEQFSAEMIFQPGADDLLAVVKIFRADEADHGIDQQRREGAGHGIGTGLDRLLVDAEVCSGREGSALASFKKHHIMAEGAALEGQSSLLSLAQYI